MWGLVIGFIKSRWMSLASGGFVYALLALLGYYLMYQNSQISKLKIAQSTLAQDFSRLETAYKRLSTVLDKTKLQSQRLASDISQAKIKLTKEKDDEMGAINAGNIILRRLQSKPPD